MPETKPVFPSLPVAPFFSIARYDPEADALYAYCVDPSYLQIDHQEEFGDGVIADVNEADEVQGIEVLNASRHFSDPARVGETDIRALIATINLEARLDSDEALGR
jgi:uncharacterized protein YuzE